MALQLLLDAALIIEQSSNDLVESSLLDDGAASKPTISYEISFTQVVTSTPTKGNGLGRTSNRTAAPNTLGSTVADPSSGNPVKVENALVSTGNSQSGSNSTSTTKTARQSDSTNRSPLRPALPDDIRDSRHLTDYGNSSGRGGTRRGHRSRRLRYESSYSRSDSTASRSCSYDRSRIRRRRSSITRSFRRPPSPDDSRYSRHRTRRHRRSSYRRHSRSYRGSRSRRSRHEPGQPSVENPAKEESNSLGAIGSTQGPHSGSNSNAGADPSGKNPTSEVENKLGSTGNSQSGSNSASTTKIARQSDSTNRSPLRPALPDDIRDSRHLTDYGNSSGRGGTHRGHRSRRLRYESSYSRSDSTASRSCSYDRSRIRRRRSSITRSFRRPPSPDDSRYSRHRTRRHRRSSYRRHSRSYRGSRSRRSRHEPGQPSVENPAKVESNSLGAIGSTQGPHSGSNSNTGADPSGKNPTSGVENKLGSTGNSQSGSNSASTTKIARQSDSTNRSPLRPALPDDIRDSRHLTDYGNSSGRGGTRRGHRSRRLRYESSYSRSDSTASRSCSYDRSRIRRRRSSITRSSRRPPSPDDSRYSRHRTRRHRRRAQSRSLHDHDQNAHRAPALLEPLRRNLSNRMSINNIEITVINEISVRDSELGLGTSVQKIQEGDTPPTAFHVTQQANVIDQKADDVYNQSTINLSAFNDDSVRDPNWEPVLDKVDKQIENEEHDEGDPSMLNDLSIFEYFESFQANVDEPPLELNKSVCAGTEGHFIDDLAKETLDQARKVNLRKTNRMAKEKGLQYVRKDGTIVAARKVRAPCKCKRKCYEKFTLAIRWQLLSNFLRLKSSGQNQFLANHMVVKLTSRVRVVNSRRTYTRIYKLPAVNGTTIVCKQMFMRTFDVKDRKLRVLAAKIIKGDGVAEDDGRLNNTSPRKISEDTIKHIKDHIKSFPAYTSHYAREESSRLYLSSDLNVKRMYELYQAKCDAEEIQAVHYTTYRIIFKSFNLSFRKRKVDTCNRCDELRVKLKVTSDATERSKIEEEQKRHHDAAKRVYAEKKRDMQKARTDPAVRTTTFDLQKQLATPYLTCGSSYYARQLYTYNLTLFTATPAKNVATCYLWDETKARRGSQEIGSCLMKDLNNLPAAVHCVNYYSDRCFGQNLNQTVVFMFCYIIETLNRNERQLQIFHKLMLTGHSHMEVDSVHGAIEQTKKRCTVDIETPHAWAVLISSIKRSVPFVVQELQQTEFQNLKSLKCRYRIPKRTDQGQILRFQDIMVFHYDTEHPGQVFIKYDVGDDTFQSFTVLGRRNQVNFESIKLEPIESQPIQLPEAKLKDLRSLLPYVQQKEYYETFLKNLVPTGGRGRKPKSLAVDHFEADLDEVDNDSCASDDDRE